MMEWLIVENNIIANKIVADEITAKQLNAKPDYPNAQIGKIYSPPSTEKDLLDAIIEQGIKLKKLEMGLNNNVV